MNSKERRGSWSLTPLGHRALCLANPADSRSVLRRSALRKEAAAPPLPHLPVAPWLWSLVVAGGHAHCRQAVHTAAVHSSQTPRQFPGAKGMFQDSLESLGTLCSLFAVKAGFQTRGASPAVRPSLITSNSWQALWGEGTGMCSALQHCSHFLPRLCSSPQGSLSCCSI